MTCIRLVSSLLAVHIVVVGARAPAAGDGRGAARLRPETIAGWNAYAAGVEERRARERRDAGRFLASDFLPTAARDRRALRAGAIVVSRVDAARSGAEAVRVPSGRVHHWIGAVFIPGPGAAALVQRIEDASPPAIQDDVVTSSVLSRAPGALHVYLRLRRSKIVTVVYNTEHDVRFERIDPDRAASTSTSTKIAEVRNPGEPGEVELTPGDDRGFLWRLNGYWRYESVPGGVIAECESISLSRDVPFVIDYVVGRLIDSTARESMERTLEALKRRFQQ